MNTNSQACARDVLDSRACLFAYSWRRATAWYYSTSLSLFECSKTVCADACFVKSEYPFLTSKL